jgi:arsenite methyltransferase
MIQTLKVSVVKLLVHVLKFLYRGNDREMSVDQALWKINKLFGIDRLLSGFEIDATVSYYSESDWAYRLYHSQSNAMHMAVSTDDTLDSRDYYYQPKFVSTQIDKIDAKRVLELGCGKGFNSIFLAKTHPTVSFIGTDITPVHIESAQKDKESLKNLEFEYGNFNKLNFPDESFDVIFAFECLCHANDFQEPLQEIFRLLKPGGKFIIFDGFRRSQLSEFPKNIQDATRLTEMAMAVQNGFSILEDWLKCANQSGLKVDIANDISLRIQPDLRRLQKMSTIFFNSYWISQIIKTILPAHLVQNSVAGILMPYVTQTHLGSLTYHEIVLSRPLKL